MANIRRNIGIPSGVVFPFAGAAAPYGYLMCDGRAISRTEYPHLFAMIGTSHGAGDGSTTFNLPDYRGNFLRGKVDVTTITGNGPVSSNNATFNGHGINRTGFKVRVTSGTLTGLAAGVDYYAIVIDTNTLAFATSLANALAGTKIAISGTNTAVITQWEDPDANNRAAGNAGGNSGNALGAVQEDGFMDHNHRFNLGYSYDRAGSSQIISTSNTSNGSTTYDPWAGFSTMSTVSKTNGGALRTSASETRPKNITVNYIIKI